MKNNKKKSLLVILFILLLAIAIGYAAFAQSLNINGTASASGNFKLQFIEPITIDPNIGATNSTYDLSSDGTTLSLNMQLEYPGAGGVVTATVKNTGSVPAILKKVTITGNDDPDINVEVITDDLNTEIPKDGTTTVRLVIKWNEASKVSRKDLSFSAKLDYEQNTENLPTTNTVNNGG